MSSTTYIPALKYRVLSRYYDPVIRLTCREKTFKSKLLEQIPPGGRYTILDVGCGTGTLTAWVKERFPNASVIGIDADEAVLAMAREKFGKRGLAIETSVGYAQHLPFEDRRFDVVLSSFLLHHLPTTQKEAALREIARVLKPGGSFYLADWDRPQNVPMRIAFFFVRLFDGFENTRAHARGEMTERIQEAGFGEVSRTHRYMTVFGTLSLWTALSSR